MKTQQKRLKAVTIRRLRKVADAILKEPHLYDQESCCRLDKDCGTPACILGWAIYLFDKKRWKKMNSYGGIGFAGAEALRLSGCEASLLFEPHEWPAKYKVAYYDNEVSLVKRARVAVRRINHFIKTNGAE